LLLHVLGHQRQMTALNQAVGQVTKHIGCRQPPILNGTRENS
jgi:hypothetical protein